VKTKAKILKKELDKVVLAKLEAETLNVELKKKLREAVHLLELEKTTNEKMKEEMKQKESHYRECIMEEEKKCIVAREKNEELRKIKEMDNVKLQKYKGIITEIAAKLVEINEQKEEERTAKEEKRKKEEEERFRKREKQEAESLEFQTRNREQELQRLNQAHEQERKKLDFMKQEERKMAQNIERLRNEQEQEQ